MPAILFLLFVAVVLASVVYFSYALTRYRVE